MKKPILIIASLVLFSFNFLSIDLGNKPSYNRKELFDTSLCKLNSIEKLTGYIDSIARQNHFHSNTVHYAVLTESVIKKRFYHGFSQYGMQQNWIAAVSNRMAGYGLSNIVIPADIAQHPYAACSQQALVMTEILKRKGLSYRSIGFPHHYAMEYLIDNKWYYFDPDMEPAIPDSCRLETRWGCLADNLKKYYDTGRFHDLDLQLGKSLPVKLGKVNAALAPNATVFQISTFYLSRLLWIFPLLAVFYPGRRSPGKVV